MAPTKQRVGALDVRAVVASVRPLILGLRVANVYDFSTGGGARGAGSSSYILKFAGRDSKVFLFIHAGFRMYTTEWKKDKGALPSPFCMRLRKALRTKKLEDIQQHGADRVVTLTFGRGESTLHLVVELYVAGNIILTDHENLILAVLRSHTLTPSAAPAAAATERSGTKGEGKGGEREQETQPHRIAVREYYRVVPPEMSLLRDGLRPVDLTVETVKRQLQAVLEEIAAQEKRSEKPQKAAHITWAQAVGRLAPFVNPALALHGLLVATEGDEGAKKRALTLEGVEQAAPVLHRAVIECLRTLRSVSSSEDFLGVGSLPVEVSSQALATLPVEGYILATRRAPSKAAGDDKAAPSSALLYDYDDFAPAILRQFSGLPILPSLQDIQREREQRAQAAVHRQEAEAQALETSKRPEKTQEEEERESRREDEEEPEASEKRAEDVAGLAAAIAAAHGDVAPGARVLLHFRDVNACVDEYFSSVDVQKGERAEAAARQEALSRVEKIKSDQEQRIQQLEEEAAHLLQQASAVEDNVLLVEQIIQLLRAALATGVDWEELARQMKQQAKEGHPLAVHVHDLKLEKQRALLLLEARPFPVDAGAEEAPGDGAEAEKPGAAASGHYDETLETVVVPVDITLSAHGNAQLLHSQVKQIRAKIHKTAVATESALAAADRKAQHAIALQDLQVLQAQQQLQKVRKPFWFEKFHWFVSSDRYLVLAGRDAQQNEILFRRYLRPQDVYVHADVHGAATCIIKNPNKDKGEDKADPLEPPVPVSTLQQCGEFAVCRSSAWSTKSPVAAWWVYGRQVSKSAPTGLYLSTGSFMIRGRRNFIQIHRLEMGFGLLFRLADEASVARHVALRKRFLQEAQEDAQTASSPAPATPAGVEVAAAGEDEAGKKKKCAFAAETEEGGTAERRLTRIGFLEPAERADTILGGGGGEEEGRLVLPRRKARKPTGFLRNGDIQQRAGLEALREVIDSRRASDIEGSTAGLPRKSKEELLAQLEQQEERQRHLEEQLNQVKQQLEEQLREASRSPSLGAHEGSAFRRRGRDSRGSVEFSRATIEEDEANASRDTPAGRRIRKRHPTGHLSAKAIAELRGEAAAAEIEEMKQATLEEQAQLVAAERQRLARRVSSSSSSLASAPCAESLRPLQQELLHRQYSAETHQLLMLEKLREVALQHGAEEVMARAESESRSRRSSSKLSKAGDDCHVTFSPDPPKVVEKTITALHVEFDGLPPEVIPRHDDPAGPLLVQIEEEMRAELEDDADRDTPPALRVDRGNDDDEAVRPHTPLRRRLTGFVHNWRAASDEDDEILATLRSARRRSSEDASGEEGGPPSRRSSPELSPAEPLDSRPPSLLLTRPGEAETAAVIDLCASGIRTPVSTAEADAKGSPRAKRGPKDRESFAVSSRSGSSLGGEGGARTKRQESWRRSPSAYSERSIVSTHSLTSLGSRFSRRVSVDEGPPPDGFTEETLPTPRELLSHSSVDLQQSGVDDEGDSGDEREIHIIVRRLSIKQEKELVRCRSADHGPTPKGFSSADVPSAKELLTLQQYLSDKLASPDQLHSEDDGTTSAGTRRSRRAVSEGSVPLFAEEPRARRTEGRSKEDEEVFLDACTGEAATETEEDAKGEEEEETSQSEDEDDTSEEEGTDDAVKEEPSKGEEEEEEEESGEKEEEEREEEEEATGEGVVQKKRVSAAERRRMKKKRELEEGEDKQKDEGEGKKNKPKGPRMQPVPRGKRGKLAKMKKKYPDQDEEERKFKMSLIGAEEIKTGGKESAPPAGGVDASPSAPKKTPGRKAAQLREERRELKEIFDEEDPGVDEKLAEQCSQIDLLTAAPLPEDALLCAVPVTAPYSAMSKYKFKAKLVPGTMKKGKAGQAVLKHFMQQVEDSHQKQLIKAVTLAEVALCMISDVRISIPGMQKKLTTAKRQKAAQKKASFADE
ncbi:signal peptidase [Besnoitia besnoiti]|uniref:Signal peptidase n=1 Tax=Besnoitia besnoiti TaxID=94643 RepID=A0A2A9MLD6_BESBE|nr:signal peptidase [Besnoitia besnoiti]PFH37131.1 signal peptidase [Besnoitia besnoiti]